MGREFCSVDVRTLTGGERFATVVRDDGCPSFLPTAWILSRWRAVALNTLLSNAQDLIHLGQCAQREGVDVHERLRGGRYLGDFEIDTLMEACGLRIEVLRRLNRPGRSKRRGERISRLVASDRVGAATKARRFGLVAEYLAYVSQFHDHQPNVSQEERMRRRYEREAMIAAINGFRPWAHGSRVPRQDADTLARISEFIASGDPATIWTDEAIRQRN